MLTKMSLLRRAECHPELRRLIDESVKTVPFQITCGTRGKAAQNAALKGGFSKVGFGNSAHNYSPSGAFDFIPDPFKGWNDLKGFEAVGRNIVETAKRLNIAIRWGADWNMNSKITDEKFVDRPHIELHPWRKFVGKLAS